MSSVTKLRFPAFTGAEDPQILEEDDSGLIMRARGTTVPSDAATGYAKGCIFTDMDASAGSVHYVNEGSETSADFNALV